MAIKITRPNGVEDVLPKNAVKWKIIESTAARVAESYGFKEIRIPTFEKTELFLRTVGETTDVVQKEMYTVMAKETKYTLRPEGTAGAIRALIQNGLLNEALPQKVYYILSCFRHERPQAGRLREFHQFGLEMAGSESPRADAEIISLAKNLLDDLGLENVELYINSIGCPVCRKKYYEIMKDYFEDKKSQLCETCLSRLEKNPMRILDCKSPVCQEISKDAPLIIDYLCDKCSDHFEKLKSYLNILGIEYKVNPKIVRGLDYYTKTVFEFVTNEIGAQGTVCGGGRYDGLIEQLGGKAVPALGFAMGIERIILLLEKQKKDFPQYNAVDLYIASMNQESVVKAMEIAKLVRDSGYSAEYDLMDRNFKSQMKYADKIGAKFLLVLGEDELKTGDLKIKNMATGEQTPLKLDDDFVDNIDHIFLNNMVDGSEIPEGLSEDLIGFIDKFKDYM